MTTTATQVHSGTSEPGDGDFRDWQAADYGDRVADFVTEQSGMRPGLVAFAEQIHGSRVLHVRSASCLGQKADAFYTEQPRIALAVRSADCLPVLLDGGSVIALVHAGMAGTVKGIVPKAVAKLRDAGAGNVSAHLGPHICDRCYVLSANNRRFLKRYSAATAFIRSRGGKETFDLAAMVTAQLKAAGVEAITADGRCTHHGTLFSSRRGHTERLLSYMMIAPAPV